MEETGNIFNIFEGYSEEKERESKNQGRFNSETDENFFVVVSQHSIWFISLGLVSIY